MLLLPLAQAQITNSNSNSNNNNNNHSNALAVAESDVWIQLDELLKLLRIASNGVGVPVPTQLLGLLPQKRFIQRNKNGDIREEDWPSNFGLVEVADTMEEESRSTVGTYSKSPFVRVDSAEYNQYSMLRRVQRLSFVVWTLTDSIALQDTENRYSPEQILRVTSTLERLELAKDKMQKVCLLLKKVLRMQG